MATRFPPWVTVVTVLFCLALLAASATTTAELAPAPAPAAAAWRSHQLLAERLLDGEGTQQCWETLMDIKSCTGEIILFFLNGEAYLGPGCCRAIRVIEQRCWAADAMLSAIGFTPQEGDMLKGYCDAGDDNDQGGGVQQHGGGSSSSSSSPPPRRAAVDDDGVDARVSVVVGSLAGRKHGPVRGRR